MLNRPFTAYGSSESDRAFPQIGTLCAEILEARREWIAAEARHWYALSRHVRIFASITSLPRLRKNDLSVLKYFGIISDRDYERMMKLPCREVISELQLFIDRYKHLTAIYDDHTKLIDEHPIRPIVTKEKCRIDSDTIAVFQALIDEHLCGVHTHGFGSMKKPSWQECYEWIAERKDADGRPFYCRSVGSPCWTSHGIKRYFQSWCRHFGFTPKEITSENRPDVKAILIMRGLPPEPTPPDLHPMPKSGHES